MPPARSRLGEGTKRDLRAVIISHGWSELAPFEAARAEGVLSIHLGPVTATVRAGEDGLYAEAPRRLTRRERETIRTCLSLDEELEDFWRLCRKDPELAWAARRRAGRVLRAPTVFADAAMVLATTNASWSLTRLIVRALVDCWGERGAFPRSEVLAEVPDAELRERARLGYRAPFLAALARRDLEGLRSDPRPTGEIYEELLAMPGFGPYAAEGMLRLLGRFEHFALDSWVVPRYHTLFPRRKCTHAALARRFARYGKWRGLAFWLVVTKEWYR